jgi:hypothetical protein
MPAAPCFLFKNTKNPMSYTARPAIVRPPSPQHAKQKNPARREARRIS